MPDGYSGCAQPKLVASDSPARKRRAVAAGPRWLKEKQVPRVSGNAASNADDVRWQDYEELVKDIYQALGQLSGVTIECWGQFLQSGRPSWELPPGRRTDESQ